LGLIFSFFFIKEKEQLENQSFREKINCVLRVSSFGLFYTQPDLKS